MQRNLPLGVIPQSWLTAWVTCNLSFLTDIHPVLGPTGKPESETPFSCLSVTVTHLCPSVYLLICWA